MYKCPVCNNETELEICNECGFDLENDYMLKHLTSSLSKIEIEKYQHKINILKEIYQRNISKQGNNQKINEVASNLNKLVKKYFNDENARRDYQIAKILYEQVAGLENAEAMNNLGLIYEYGKGVDQDYQKAKEYYQRAIELGSIEAINNLGCIYYEGKGINQDYQKAKEYFIRAIELGNIEAKNNLDFISHKDKTEPYRINDEQAARLEIGEAKNNLGIKYKYGKGVEKDYQKAKEYFEQAISLNCTDALLELGDMYRYGRGVKMDKIKARKYYQQAIDLGNLNAFEYRENVDYELEEQDSPFKRIKNLLKK